MSKHISRRGFIFSGAAVGATAFSPEASEQTLLPGSSSARRGLHNTLTDGTDRTLTVRTSFDPEFDAQMKEYFPAIVGDHTSESLKVFCAILHNRQGSGIHAYKLRWEYALQSSTYATELSTFSRPRPGRVQPVDFCPRTAARVVLRRGCVALVSPFFAITPRKEAVTTPVHWDNLIKQSAFQGFLYTLAPQIRQANVSILSAIYSDYKVLDTDGGEFATLIQHRRNSETRLAKAVLQKLENGTPDARLRGALNRTHVAESHLGTREQMISHRTRKHHASYLHDVLVAGGRESLRVLVSKQAQQPQTAFQRLPLSS